jgi:hypothetical protein
LTIAETALCYPRNSTTQSKKLRTYEHTRSNPTGRLVTPCPIQYQSGASAWSKSHQLAKFWDVYREDKELCKKIMGEAGITLGKFRDLWELTWWSDDELKVSPNNRFR